MNELEMVHELYGDPPPPSARAVAAARAGMMRDDAPRLRRRAPLPVLGGLVAAGTAAAAVAAALTVPGGDGSGGPGRAPDQDLSARSILLVAAERAAKEPTGEYWRTHTVQEIASYTVGSGEGNYIVSRSSESAGWWPRSGSGTFVSYYRALGTRPATAADEAAWRRDGSPRSWRVRTADDPRRITVEMQAPGAWQTYRMTPRDREKVCGQGKKCDEMSWTERERVVAEPGGLERLLFPERGKARRSGGRESWRAPSELMVAADFLMKPASPRTRAAAFRLLADRPQIRSIGRVTDMRGRTGIGLSARGTTNGGADGAFDYQLILDPRTYRVLGTQYVVVREGGRFPGIRPGTAVERRAVLDVGWTNESPHHG